MKYCPNENLKIEIDSEFLDGMKPYDATRYKEILDGIDDCYKTMQEFVRANFKEAEKMVSTT